MAGTAKLTPHRAQSRLFHPSPQGPPTSFTPVRPTRSQWVDRSAPCHPASQLCPQKLLRIERHYHTGRRRGGHEPAGAADVYGFSNFVPAPRVSTTRTGGGQHVKRGLSLRSNPEMTAGVSVVSWPQPWLPLVEWGSGLSATTYGLATKAGEPSHLGQPGQAEQAAYGAAAAAGAGGNEMKGLLCARVGGGDFRLRPRHLQQRRGGEAD